MPRFIFLFVLFFFSISIGANKSQDNISRLLESELRKNFTSLNKLDSTFYYLAYRMNDSLKYSFTANCGGILDKSSTSSRFVDIDLRVGSPEIDNTHKNIEDFYVNYPYGIRNLRIPLNNDSLGLISILKFSTDYAFRNAKQKTSHIINQLALNPKEKRSGIDFAAHIPLVTSSVASVAKEASGSKDILDTLYQSIIEASKLFNSYSFILSSSIHYNYSDVLERLVTTEGTNVSHRKKVSSINVYVETMSDDGMVLWLDKNVYGSKLSPGLSLDSLKSITMLLIKKLDTLRNA
ncbi:MAG: hypothetical protein HRT71_02505, partial [Flavobacteriales bacterium]|nr:hypothetical protein [Flavobacteriales bacterium]